MSGLHIQHGRGANIAFSNELACYRGRTGLSMTEMAQLLDISKSQLSRLTAGKTQLSTDIILKLCELVGIPDPGRISPSLQHICLQNSAICILRLDSKF